MTVPDGTRPRLVCEANPDAFFPDYVQNNGYEAREACSTCRILDTCRTEVLNEERGYPADTRFGIRAGMAPTDRWIADQIIELTEHYAGRLQELHSLRRLHPSSVEELPVLAEKYAANHRKAIAEGMVERFRTCPPDVSITAPRRSTIPELMAELGDVIVDLHETQGIALRHIAERLLLNRETVRKAYHCMKAAAAAAAAAEAAENTGREQGEQALAA